MNRITDKYNSKQGIVTFQRQINYEVIMKKQGISHGFEIHGVIGCSQVLVSQVPSVGAQQMKAICFRSISIVRTM